MTARRSLTAVAAFAGMWLALPTSVLAQSDAQRFGRVSFANSGAAAAQPAFLRGIALLHDFQYSEAVEAFREAQRIDPGFAMAYWGEAMSYNHGVWREQDSVAARAVLVRLGTTSDVRLAKAPTAREKDYVRLLDVLYGTAGTKPSRDSAFAVGAAQLAKQYPADDEAQLLHALALLQLFPRTDSTYEQAAAIAERVRRVHPDHPGALHYIIHAYDDPAHAAAGLTAARAYSKVAPAAGHAQHMTSHIFIALGMWDDVVHANEIAIGLKHTPDALIAANCGHAGLWLDYAYLEQGRWPDAKRMMDGCFAHAGDSATIARGYAEMRLRSIIDMGAAGADVPPLPGNVRGGAVIQFMQAYGSAYDALERRDTIAARSYIDQMVAARMAIARGPRRPNTDQLLGNTQVSVSEMQALMLMYAGQHDAAIALLRAAAAAEDTLPFMFGPPEVQKPSHELLGELLLPMHRPSDAKREFERALRRTPGRSLSLLGLARASRAAGDSAASLAAYRTLLVNWHRADTRVRALGEARHGAGADTTPALSQGELISFAVLPLPAQLRAGAGVVMLDAHQHMIELRKTANGMVCARIVPGEAAWDARCYHEAFAPLFFRAGELAAQGLKRASVDAEMDREIKGGTLHPPSRPVAGYRVLGPASSYDPSTGVATSDLRAWQSVHAPYQTAAEFGFPDEKDLSESQRASMPFVMASGTWWAHVMILHATP